MLTFLPKIFNGSHHSLVEMQIPNFGLRLCQIWSFLEMPGSFLISPPPHPFIATDFISTSTQTHIQIYIYALATPNFLKFREHTTFSVTFMILHNLFSLLSTLFLPPLFLKIHLVKKWMKNKKYCVIFWYIINYYKT